MVPFIWVIIGVALLGLYNALLILDDKTSEADPLNKNIEEKWHFVGFTIFLYLSATAWIMWGWVYVPLMLTSFWCLFAGIVHTVALKKSFFFVGTTAKTDILLRKIFKNKAELWSAILKILSIVLSIVLVFMVDK